MKIFLKLLLASWFITLSQLSNAYVVTPSKFLAGHYEVHCDSGFLLGQVQQIKSDISPEGYWYDAHADEADKDQGALVKEMISRFNKKHGPNKCT